jgi:uncharacterized sulfatase
MLNYLDSTGELVNTLVIVTADNGMPFPGAKANAFEYGIHVPMAISYPAKVPGGRVVEDPVSFVDLAPTILSMSATKSGKMLPISGRDISHILKSRKSGIVDESKKYVFSGRERHSSSRWNNLGYPVRAIRSVRYLLIWNIKPDLWPAGDPQAIESETGKLLPMFGIDDGGKHHSDWAFTDVDASPSKSFIIENYAEKDLKLFFDLSFSKRPEYELYNVQEDPFCINNLSGKAECSSIEEELKDELMKELIRSSDPRVIGPDREVFDSYPRYSPIREFPKH